MMRYGRSAPCNVKTWSPWAVAMTRASTSPDRIARSVSSASSSLARSSSTLLPRSLVTLITVAASLAATLPGRERTQLEADQDPFGVRQVPDERAQRQRQVPDERGCGHDPLLHRERGLLVQVDDRQVDPAFQFLVAQLPDLCDRSPRPRRGAGDVEGELVAMSA